MIDYILDNMVVGHYELHKKARTLRSRNKIEFTICEEIEHEQRLADVDHRKAVQADSKTLVTVDNLDLLAELANEMIDIGALDLDEGGGDVMVVYEAVSGRPPNLFVTERIVVSDDLGVQACCDNHEQKWISTDTYRSEIDRL